MAIFNLLRYSIPKDYKKAIIIDTNIWLILYSELHETKEREIAAYSSFFEEILENEIDVIITASILSEISNVLLRADFNSLADTKGWNNFKKDYVGSEYYKNKVSDINSIIDSILSNEFVKRIDDQFSNVNLEKIKENFNLLDWNDAYIYELSLRYGYDILSHDRDFKKLDFSTIDLIQLN